MPEVSQGKSINELGSRPINSHSKFNNSYQLAGTYRYGEYAPHFVADAVPDDNHVLRSRHAVRSYTLNAPLLEGISIKKDYFLVPDSALIPRNYEKFIVAPNIGEDIDASKIGTSVVGFRHLIYDYFVKFGAHIASYDDSFSNDAVTDLWRYMLLRNLMLSEGSLLASLGCHIIPRSPKRKLNKNDIEFDKFVKDFFAVLEANSGYLAVTLGDQTFYVDPGENSGADDEVQIISIHEFISRCMDDFSFELSVLGASPEDFDDFASVADDYPMFLNDDEDGVVPTDFRRCLAYQICCAHFFSNDKVDYMYSAELYRQFVESLYRTIFEGTLQTFTWNGETYLYDTFAAYNFIYAFDVYGDSDISWDEIIGHVERMQLLRLIFGFNRSLRFVDYFTGSRTRPLAVGDANVAVNSGYVNVVETMQKRWYIKLWNQVQRVGRRLSEQMQGMFPGVQNSTDWHEPIWLAHTSDNIHPEEVDNTASEQFDPTKPIPVTASLHGNAENYAFDININDRYGTIIGIQYFDISRFYTNATERSFFHVDRFDRFNPFLQFVGDQKVYREELSGGSHTSGRDLLTFGYQGRNMEYKQRYNQAFGGFVNNALPGMLFLADVGRLDSDMMQIKPDYIRSYPSELDDFYKSLSGYSLGTYFHFIIISTNDFISNRPMVYNPQID